MQQTITPASTKGVIISLILIVISLIGYFMDINPQNGFQYIGYVIFIAGIVWSVMNYGHQVDYTGTFGSYFSHGFKVTALITLIMIIFTVIFILLFPEIRTKGMEAASEAMHKNPKMTDEQIKAGLDITRRFFWPMIIGTILLGYIFFGAISSLIASAITKKNQPIVDSIDEIKPLG